ncbi:MAG: hypothetical protein ABEI52_03175 [Halobacteriaceae archaeon]
MSGTEVHVPGTMTTEWEDDERAPFSSLPWDRPTRNDVQGGGNETEEHDGTARRREEEKDDDETNDDAEDYTFHIPDEVRRKLGWCFWTPFE